MSGFSTDWLSLREPADAAARARALVEQLLRTPRPVQPQQVQPRPERPWPAEPWHAQHWPTQERPAREWPAQEWPAQEWQIVDLGAGTGANLRYLAPLLGGPQAWRLVDRDPALLDAAADCLQAWAQRIGAELTQMAGEIVIRAGRFECRAQRERLDLAGNPAALSLPPGALVSASALLDLVSESWLRGLARRCFDAGASVLFALTYDGRVGFSPPEAEDDRVRALVDRHQLTDKGFGPALGPAAAQRTATVFRELGYRVRSVRSDWRLGPDQRALQTALLDGWIDAAAEIAPDESRQLERWRIRRRRHIDRGGSTLTVGHVDLLGWLPEPGPEFALHRLDL